MESIINDIYTEYKMFCNNNELPNLIINIEDLEGIRAYVDTDNATEYTVPLYIDNLYLTKYINELKSLLYHEFTHILDMNKFFKEKAPYERRNMSFVYSEFHASQVQMMCHVGFSNINDSKKFSPYSSILYHESNKSILSFLTSQCAENLARVNIAHKKRDDDNFKTMVYQTIYNIGYYDICKKFSDNHAESIILLDIFPDYMQHYIDDIISILLNGFFNDEICENLYNIVGEMWYAYTDHFK